MTSQQLREARDAVPFRPFSIRMADGQAYEVPHRDYLSISPTGRTAIVYRTSTEAFRVLDVMLITSLDIEAVPTISTGADAGTANGA